MTEFCIREAPEETVYIDLPETSDLKIKGIVRGALEGPLVVMMHGRPGTGDDLLEYLGARYLQNAGYNTLRLFMYGYEVNTRNLVDSTLETHVDDFETVIHYLDERAVQPVFAIGHSYGGLTILKSKVDLAGAVLWDPSHGLAWSEGKFHEGRDERAIDEYIIGLSGKGSIVSKVMHEQDIAMGDTSQLAASKTYPLQIISAGDSVLADFGGRYYDAAGEPKDFVKIEGADHNFRTSDAVMNRLFAETTRWLKEIQPGHD